MICTSLQISLQVFLSFHKIFLAEKKLNSHPGGKMPSQGEDLAVLSLCNHSIIGVRPGGGQEGEFVQNMFAWAHWSVRYSRILQLNF